MAIKEPYNVIRDGSELMNNIGAVGQLLAQGWGVDGKAF